MRRQEVEGTRQRVHFAHHTPRRTVQTIPLVVGRRMVRWETHMCRDW